jgi:hypothetical protein
LRWVVVLQYGGSKFEAGLNFAIVDELLVGQETSLSLTASQLSRDLIWGDEVALGADDPNLYYTAFILPLTKPFLPHKLIP